MLAVCQMTARPAKTVFTVALGEDKYFNMALTLARSFLANNKSQDLQFWIYTDRARALPRRLRQRIKLRTLAMPWASPSLEFKTNFDQFAPPGPSLFVDCDCLIVNDLQHVFEMFDGSEVGVAGLSVVNGEWCGADVARVLAATGLKSMPRFNGGLYYIDRRSPLVTSIFEHARMGRAKYDGLGFVRLGKQMNDEPLNSLALARFDVKPIGDDGSIMSDVNCDLGSRVDALGGGATIVNYPVGHPGHKWWYGNSVVHPSIVHYGSHGNRSIFLRREALKLIAFCDWRVPRGLVARVVDPFFRLLAAAWSGPRARRL